MGKKKHLILALDLGGTRFRVALIDEGGKILRRHAAPTEVEKGRENVFKRISAAIKETIPGLEDILGLGIAAPGPLDPKTGSLLKPPNLTGWENAPLKSMWERELGLPIYVGNDANVAALGEHRFGAGKGVSHLIYITVSTGVGGGIIIDNRLFLGGGGLAGEVGHMVIDRKGPPCRCGNRGCLEALASGTAIARIAVECIKEGRPTNMLTLVDNDVERVTAETVVAAARSGDALAQEILQNTAVNLGTGIVNLLHLFNPQLVIIGGGVSRAGDLIFEPLRQTVSQGSMPGFAEGVPIVPSALGDDAGLLGAAVLVLDNVRG